MVIEQTYGILQERCPELIGQLIINDVRIGVCLTAVRLSDGSTGVASTIADKNPHGGVRDFGELTPHKIRGRKIADILGSEKETGIINSLRLAILNALSSKFITTSNYKIIVNKDPVDLVDLDQTWTITIVGAFQSYIRKIAALGCRLYVLEMKEEALSEEYRKFYVPAEKFNTVIPASDLVIITGQTLVNGTIDSLLGSVSQGAMVIVTGPSCSLLPDVLFSKGVGIVGSLRITDTDLMFEIVGEGGAGYHLFEYCGEKICILNGESQIK